MASHVHFGNLPNDGGDRLDLVSDMNSLPTGRLVDTIILQVDEKHIWNANVLTLKRTRSPSPRCAHLYLSAV